MAETEVKTALITPDKKELSFMANGKKYFIEKKVSIARRMICDELVVEVSGGGNMGNNFNDWKKVYELSNGMKFADIVVLAYNRMEGVKKWKENHDPVMALCALYINEEKEDRRFLSQEQIKAKIADWEAEGIEYAFFLNMANSLLMNLTGTSSDTSPSTSES